MKICSKVTGEHTCQRVISIMLLCNFIEIAFQHGCFIVNLLHIFWVPFPENTCWWPLLYWNRTSARVFSRKFTVYFQKIFPENTCGAVSVQHLWSSTRCSTSLYYKINLTKYYYSRDNRIPFSNKNFNQINRAAYCVVNLCSLVIRKFQR